MADEKEIVLLNNDAASFKHAVLTIAKVFGFSQNASQDVALAIDAYGAAVVFQGPEDEVAEKMELLRIYGESIGQSIEGRMQPAGTHQKPAEVLATSGSAATLKLKDFVFGNATLSALWEAVSSTVGPEISIQGESKFVLDVKGGKEVILREFEGPQAEQKADFLKDALMQVLGINVSASEISAGDKRRNDNICVEVRAPGYVLPAPSALRSESDARPARRGGRP